MSNPLYDCPPLLNFCHIKAEHVVPAIEQLITEANETIAAVTLNLSKEQASWDNFVQPLSLKLDHFNRAWTTVHHMLSVVNSPEWRDAQHSVQQQVSNFFSQLGQNQLLYQAYLELSQSQDYQQLSTAQKRVIELACRDFRLSGVDLPSAAKARFSEIDSELARLSVKFNENLLDATDAFKLNILEINELQGIPPEVLSSAALLASGRGEQGYTFTLHAPCYFPLMQYAANRQLREKMYRAYATRAAEFPNQDSQASWDNSPVIMQILQLKKERAQLLGFNSHAEYSLASKMADNVDQVIKFLSDLAKHAKTYAETDYAHLKTFALDKLAINDLAAWDMAYAAEKLRQQKYDYSEQEVKEYFAESSVLAGIFHLIEQLFALKVRVDSADVWHETVKFYRLENSQGEVVGQFYLDLYARTGKQSGAWMNDLCARKRDQAGLRTPVALISCNFQAPLADSETFLNHGEVVTLFHEMGHCLHHLLSEVDVLGVSGINGVEWDAVELPSQFFENYAWQWPVVESMSKHRLTAQKIPKSLFERMLAARHFHSGLAMLRQVEFSLFDILLHHDFTGQQIADVYQLLELVRQQIAVIFPPQWHRMPNSFAHIFADSYSAGYYSYKWAEVLSSDVFAAFEEAGDPFSAQVGKRLQQEILARGGERPALENFIAFRGREPQIDALLRHSGM